MSLEPAPNAPGHRKLNPILKLVLELGPLVLFFLANAHGQKLAAAFPAAAALGGPIFLATAVFIAATLLALVVSYALTRQLPLMPLVSAIVVVVFGGLTLWLHDERFIKVKPTIIYCLFAGILLGGLLFGRSLLGYVLDSMMQLTDEGWRKLTLRWGLFFLGLAVLNEIVWRTVSTDTWVTFKAFGVLPLTFVFAMFQMRLINRHAIEPASGESAGE